MIDMSKNERKPTEAGPKENTEKESSPDPRFVIESSLGRVSIDMKAYADAKAAAHALMPKLTRQNMFDSKMFMFLNVTKTQRDSRYWKGHLGALMKMHLDGYLEPEYEVSEEFSIEDGILRPCMYDTIALQGKQRQRIMVIGTRFYQSKVDPAHRFTLISSVDGDGDHRITIHTPTGHSMNTERYDFTNFINQLEEDFYENGPLNQAFFDLKYNFVERDTNIDALLAWDPVVKETLW